MIKHKPMDDIMMVYNTVFDLIRAGLDPCAMDPYLSLYGSQIRLVTPLGSRYLLCVCTYK